MLYVSGELFMCIFSLDIYLYLWFVIQVVSPLFKTTIKLHLNKESSLKATLQVQEVTAKS